MYKSIPQGPQIGQGIGKLKASHREPFDADIYSRCGFCRLWLFCSHSVVSPRHPLNAQPRLYRLQTCPASLHIRGLLWLPTAQLQNWQDGIAEVRFSIPVFI